MPYSHSFFLCRVYYAIMKCNKRGFFVISFSLFFTVCYAASSTLPGDDGFPPSPTDQEVSEEDSYDFNSDTDIDDDDMQEDERPELPFDKPGPEFPERGEPKAPPPHLPPKDADKIFYYRGNRTYSEELPLKINFIRCIRDEDGRLIIMIVFNQSVNPRTVNHASVLIDGDELPEDLRFSFNKKGDTIRVVIPDEEQEEFLISVQDICAFNGACIEPVELLAEVEN